MLMPTRKAGYMKRVFALVSFALATSFSAGCSGSAMGPVNTSAGAASNSSDPEPLGTVSVRAYGAKGDGVSDDTVPIQNALNAANGQVCVYFPGGAYSVSNLTIPNGACLYGDGYDSQIIANNKGSSQYLIADRSWVTPGANYDDGSEEIRDLLINANNIKGSALVMRAWNSIIDHVWLSGSTGATTIGGSGSYGADLLWTTSAQDGTAYSGSMVNNSVENSFLGSESATMVEYNFYVYDPSFHITDFHLMDNYFDGTEIASTLLTVPDAAGWQVTGNHFYGAKIEAPSPCIQSGFTSTQTGCDAIFQETNWYTVISDNIFEESVIYNNAGQNGDLSRFGPGNEIGLEGNTNSKFFIAGFGNYSNDTTISFGNSYNSGAQIMHDYSAPDKVLISIDDTFEDPNPIIKLGLGQVSIFGSTGSNGSMYDSGPTSGSMQWNDPQSFGTAPSANPTAPIDITNSGDGEALDVHYPNGVGFGFSCYNDTCNIGTTNNADVLLGANTAGKATRIYGGGLESITANGDGTVAIKQGSNKVYVCDSAGTLPQGTLTIAPSNCGSSHDTGLRVN
jgi:hypothetical protein